MKHVAVAALAGFVVSAVSSAQSPLFAQVGEALPDGMGQLIAAADYEGDGDVDLFTSSGVFLNDDGFFRPGPRLPASFDPFFNMRSVAVADFDGDGRVDVLAGSVGGPAPGLVLYAAPAGGGAEFVAGAGAIAGAVDAFEFAVVDVDADGDVDVVAANASSPAGFRLLLNDGLGGFSVAPNSQWPASQVGSVIWIGAGDFDGDGWTDVAAVLGFGAPVWRRNLGGGVFGGDQTLGVFAAQPSSGVIGDFDGDTFADLIVFGAAGQDGTFSGSPIGLGAGTLATSIGIPGSGAVAADIDGDGDDDLVRSVVEVSGSITGDLVLQQGALTGLGSPALLGSVRFGFDGLLGFPGATIVDVEGDGDRDLVIAPGGVSPWMVLDAGVLGPTLASTAVPLATRGLFAPPRDVDGDGDPDLLQASIASGTVSLQLHRNDGRGCFAEAPVSAGASSAASVGSAQWADFDNDGDPDLLVRGVVNQPARILLNDGAGTFSLAAIVPVTGSATAAAVGDFDGDQLVDVVIGRTSPAVFPPMPLQPLLVRGIPSPTGVAFAAPEAFGIAANVTGLALLDVGSDGDLDLVASSFDFTGAAVRVYENDGVGSFAASAPFPVAPSSAPTAVAAADLDADGCDDLVLGGEVWMCQPGGAFALQSTHTEPTGAIALADVDGDLLLDLVDSAGAWYRGDGAGDFGPAVTFVPFALGIPNTGGGAVPVDFDGDGDLDMIGPGGATRGHFAIYSNLTRHAARSSLGIPGRPLELSVYGSAGEPWLLAVSLPTAGAAPLPPFGTLFLDPGSVVPLLAGLTPSAGRSDVEVPIPASGAGFVLTWQAVVGLPLQLTNAFDTPILP